MRRFPGLLAALFMVVGSVVQAQSGPVVVELYTSQGCSSCPPADAYFLKELAERDDVIALSLHVDYWDYIGWKDHFADPKFTKRQKSYAKAAGHRTVYTPQLIIAGKDHVIGTKPDDVRALLRKHKASHSPVRLKMTRRGQTVTIAASATRPVGRAVVQLVRYKPLESVKIKRGENAGRTVQYANIVESWTMLGVWDGRDTVELSARVQGDLPVVAIIQKSNFGPVLAAARLK